MQVDDIKDKEAGDECNCWLFLWTFSPSH